MTVIICTIVFPVTVSPINLQVHAITYKCNGLASCNCGALIKIGNDVIRIDRCPKRRRSRYLPMKAYLFKNGELTPGTTFGIRGRTFVVSLLAYTITCVERCYLSRSCSLALFTLFTSIQLTLKWVHFLKVILYILTMFATKIQHREEENICFILLHLYCCRLLCQQAHVSA